MYILLFSDWEQIYHLGRRTQLTQNIAVIKIHIQPKWHNQVEIHVIQTVQPAQEKNPSYNTISVKDQIIKVRICLFCKLILFN